MNGMSWLWLALIAGGAGWAGYKWSLPSAPKAGLNPRAKAKARYLELMAKLGTDEGLSAQQQDEVAALENQYPDLIGSGQSAGWVGSPRYFGSGTAGPRPDFVMGQQLQAGGGMFAPISGGSIGY